MTQGTSLSSTDMVWSAQQQEKLVRALAGSRVLEQVSASMRESLPAIAATSSIQSVLARFAEQNNKLAEIVAHSSAVNQAFAQLDGGLWRLLADRNRRLVPAMTIPQSVVDFAMAQSKLAEFAASPAIAALGQHSATIAAFTSASRLAEALLGASHVSDRLFAQATALAALPQVRLQIPVNHAARAWRLAIQSSRLETVRPELLVDLGFVTDAVNTAAYAVETVERPSGELWYVARASVDVETREMQLLLAWLDEVDPRLPLKLKGAWHAVHGRGPDWISQSANSGVELLDWTLRGLAPDEAVMPWREATGLYASELHNGRPTRALRVRYIAHTRDLPVTVVEHAAKAVNSTLRKLQKLKHADGETMAQALTSALISLEHALLVLQRGC